MNFLKKKYFTFAKIVKNIINYGTSTIDTDNNSGGRLSDTDRFEHCIE